MAHWRSVLLAVILTLAAVDFGCEYVTGDRCTMGIPTPVTEEGKE